MQVALGALGLACADPERPYLLPVAAVREPLAFVGANQEILRSGWTTDYKLGIANLIGDAIRAANRILKLNPHTPALNWRAASWLPVYLVGTGLIVYASDFGPLTNPWFPLWWDMVAVTVFSLAIYAWAQRVALSREEIERQLAELPEGDALPEAVAERPSPAAGAIASPLAAACRR